MSYLWGYSNPQEEMKHHNPVRKINTSFKYCKHLKKQRQIKEREGGRERVTDKILKEIGSHVDIKTFIKWQ